MLSAAEVVLERIMSSLKYLEEFPYAGVRLNQDSLSYFDFRMILSEPCTAFYRILHGAQDYIQILKQP